MKLKRAGAALSLVAILVLAGICVSLNSSSIGQEEAPEVPVRLNEVIANDTADIPGLRGMDAAI